MFKCLIIDFFLNFDFAFAIFRALNNMNLKHLKMLEEKNDNLSMNLNETDGSVENVLQDVAQTEIQEIAEPTENLVSEMETAPEAIEEEVP